MQRILLAGLLSLAMTLVSRSALADETAGPVFTFTVKNLPQSKAELDTFLANFRTSALPQIETLHTCPLTTKLVAENYRDLKSLFFGLERSGNKALLEADFSKALDYPFDSNLVRNFKILKESQTVALTYIKNFHDSMKISDSASLEEVKVKIESLNTSVASLSQSLVANAIKENAFLYILDDSIEQLKTLALNSQKDLEFLASDKCLSLSTHNLAVFLKKDFDEMQANVTEMREYLAESRLKRSKLVTYLTQYHRYKLTRRYGDITGQELESLKSQIIDVLAAGQLITEFYNWWSNAIVNGPADQLDTLYSQYEAPLRLMRARQEGARAYIARIEAVSNAPESMKAIIRNDIQVKIDLLEKSILGLEAKGWQGQLKRQLVGVEFLEKSTFPY
ncbi:MAG: hypothetical protein NTX25_00505, partial [Proteobacteria bacterium]|nr:hypothetical protein [Pseudomonadota bacterium]